MKEKIIEMANKNIGSLCLFLKNKVNKEYLEVIELNTPDEIKDRMLSEKIYYFVNDIQEIQLCNCKEHLSFIGFKNGYRSTCGKKECFVNKRRETCIEKYGVDNPKKSKEILLKEKEDIKAKWNGKHYMFDKNVKEKFNNTMIKNHGVEWAQQSIEISEKSKQTFSLNINKEEIIANRSMVLSSKSSEEKEIIKNKKFKKLAEKYGSVEVFYNSLQNIIRENSLEKYGTDHHFSSKDVIEKRVSSYKDNITNKIKNKLPNNIIYLNRKDNQNTTDSIIELFCNNCQSNFEINRQHLKFRIESNKEICLLCNPILHGKSGSELEVLEFITTNYKGEIISNTKNIISKELDIYLPELKLAFEFNGLFWHSENYKDRKYHLDKTNECLSKGIQLIHIWEDDWNFKGEIVKSIILNKIGISEKIFARKCQIKELTDNKLVKEFLTKNHIQGFVGSKVKIGLFYNSELVSLMTFGNLRKSLGQKSSEGGYELLRFCSKLNISVVGGASRLLKYFIKNNNPKQITSYSDSSRSNGNLYEKLGFKFVHKSEPNYYYVIDEMRYHRFNFRKDKLVKQGADPNKTEIEIMHGREIFRIFDCGSKKWIMNL